MMRIHREGWKIIGFTLVGLVVVNIVGWWLSCLLACFLIVASTVFFALVVQFFRDPLRLIPHTDEKWIYAPADGKVVVIEKTMELEYLRDERIQVSIFMSPLNVHVNRAPIAGEVAYVQSHPGKYLVAWHPKSSTENERTTTVLESKGGPVLVRQIAGAVARRIKNYTHAGQRVRQGEEIGFILFGSRVDVFLPCNAEILVLPGQRVYGNITLIAKLK